MAGGVLPFALRILGADGLCHVCALEAARVELTDPSTKLTAEASRGIGVDAASSVAEQAVAIPLARRVGIASRRVGVLDLAGLLAAGVGGEAGFVAWAGVERQRAALRFALHELGVPLACRSGAVGEVECGATSGASVGIGVEASGRLRPAVDTGSRESGAVVDASGSTPRAA